MKLILTVLISLFFAVWLGSVIQKDPGYMLLAYQNQTVEMPLWVGLILMGLLFFACYLTIRCFKVLGGLNHRWQHWREQRRIARSHSRTSQGLMALTEGQWGVAEKRLSKALPHSDSPLINYLSAARAANAQEAYERREKYLRQALKQIPQAACAIQITRAECQLEHQQYAEALSTLSHLHREFPKHPQVLKYLAILYRKQFDWPHLIGLLPELKRYNIFSPEVFADISQQTHRGLLHLANNSEALKATWQKLPHDDPDLMLTYIKLLHQYKDQNTAEQVMRPYLKKYFHEGLISLYGQTPSDNPSTRLNILESWLKQYPENPELLLAAGRVCLQRQLWGKARTYFDNSLKLNPKSETYAEQAALLERLGETHLATEHYRQGLALAHQVGVGNNQT